MTKRSHPARPTATSTTPPSMRRPAPRPGCGMKSTAAAPRCGAGSRIRNSSRKWRTCLPARLWTWGAARVRTPFGSLPAAGAVTGLDVSAVALERAAAHARERGQDATIEWVQQDLATWVPDRLFDLVTAQFLHSTQMPWQQALQLAAAAVRTGGTLLIVGHHPDGLPPWGAHHTPEKFFTAEDLARELRIEEPLWRVEVLDSRQRSAIGPDGEAVSLRMPCCGPRAWPPSRLPGKRSRESLPPSGSRARPFCRNRITLGIDRMATRVIHFRFWPEITSGTGQRDWTRPCPPARVDVSNTA